jgi:iron complex transport system ATP-binding protein
VSVILDEKLVLDGINWEVRRGENWVIIGPNGSGKTTLLSVINGYKWPYKGDVSVMGKGFGSVDLRELRRKIGMVSSFMNQWFDSSEKVLDVVVSGKYASTKLWRTAVKADFEMARTLLKTLGCSQTAGRSLKEVSQGERQKIMIARALMARPKLLTLDEPCEGLDLKARESFLSGLAAVVKQKTPTIIDVTHRIDEIPHGFTHALLMKEGKALAVGNIEDVITRKNLSRCFDVSVRVKRFGGRFYTIVDRARA